MQMFKKVAGILGWLGVALVLSAVAIKFLKPEWYEAQRYLSYAGLACVVIYMAGQWREFAAMFTSRQAKLGTLAGAGVLIVLAILVAVNYLANRHNKRWDLTETKQFTLSDQTKRVLQSLTAPVKIRVFARDDDFTRYRNRLNEYEYASRQVSTEYIDVDKKPAAARQFNVQTYGTVVFDYQGRQERVTTEGEQELTNALIKVVQGRQNKVFFTQGHGEKDTGGSDRDGYSQIATALGSDNFAVEKLVLPQVRDVPPDATAVVVAGPTADFLASEVDAIKAYLRRGGKLLLLLDPPDKADSPPLSNLIALAKEWSIDVGQDVVVDVSGIGQLFGGGVEVPVAANYPNHPITDRFNLLTAYPLARSVAAVSGGAQGRFAQVFVETSPRSWAETDLKKLYGGQLSQDDAKGDKTGPIGVAAAVSAAAAEAPPAEKTADGKPSGNERKPETRVAVVGDSDFGANAWLGIRGNRDLFLNVVNWLAQQENLIAIRPKEATDRRITLTREQQMNIFWLSVVMIPGVVIATGVYTWWRRR